MNYLFRGKTNQGIWVEGGFVESGGYSCIVDDDGTLIPVLPESVGMWTTVLDKTGEKIFGGDICRLFINRNYKIGKVIFDDGCFFIDDICELDSAAVHNEEIEVIGNLTDNPELITK